MFQKKFNFFKGTLRSGPLPILASCPSPCRFHLPVLPDPHVTSPGLQTLIGGMPLPCCSFWLQFSPILFHSGQLNLPLLQHLARGLSSRNFSIISSNVIWKLLLPVLWHPGASFRASASFILSGSILDGEGRDHDYLFCIHPLCLEQCFLALKSNSLII